jgi:hypothetical protein
MNAAVKNGISIMLVFPIFLSFAHVDAQIDISGATNLSPQEEASALASNNRLQSNIAQSPPYQSSLDPTTNALELELLNTLATGQNKTYPFAPDMIQDDGDRDGYSTCDDPVLLVKVQCPVGWELEEEEGSISFRYPNDSYTSIIIEKQNIFPINNTADYMRDILDLERESGDIDIINMSETSINGMQAHRAEHTSIPFFKTDQYFIVDPEYTGYIIKLNSNSDNFDRHVPTFERVANSFERTS